MLLHKCLETWQRLGYEVKKTVVKFLDAVYNLMESLVFHLPFLVLHQINGLRIWIEHEVDSKCVSLGFLLIFCTLDGYHTDCVSTHLVQLYET